MTALILAAYERDELLALKDMYRQMAQSRTTSQIGISSAQAWERIAEIDAEIQRREVMNGRR